MIQLATMSLIWPKKKKRAESKAKWRHRHRRRIYLTPAALADSAPFLELGWNIYVFSAILTCLFRGGIPMPKRPCFLGNPCLSVSAPFAALETWLLKGNSIWNVPSPDYSWNMCDWKGTGNAREATGRNGLQREKTGINVIYNRFKPQTKKQTQNTNKKFAETQNLPRLTLPFPRCWLALPFLDFSSWF